MEITVVIFSICKTHAKTLILLQKWKKDVAKMLRWSLNIMNR